MTRSARKLALLAALATLLASATAATGGFTDVLDRPATISSLATQRLLQATTMAGKRVVTVICDSGERYMSLPFFAP